MTRPLCFEARLPAQLLQSCCASIATVLIGCNSSSLPDRVPVLEYEDPSKAQQEAADDAAVREMATGRMGELTELFGDAKANQEWDEAARLVEATAAVGPRYPKNWAYLAWQLAFEISTAAEGHVFRYDYARRGITVLLQGLERMDRHPQLLFDLGSIFRSRFRDETDGEQLHKAFRNDQEFHKQLRRYIDLDATLGSDGLPHHRLVACEFYRLMEQELDTRGVPRDWELPTTMVLLYTFSWNQRMFFAMDVQREEVPREYCRQSWHTAQVALDAFAEREFHAEPGLRFRMSDAEVGPDGKPRLLRRPEDEVEQQLTDEVRTEWIIRYQNMVNYRYWRQRVAAEQSDELLQAWEQLRRSREFLRRTRNEDVGASEWEAGLQGIRQTVSAWDAILDRHEFYAEDESLTQALDFLRNVADDTGENAPPAGD